MCNVCTSFLPVSQLCSSGGQGVGGGGGLGVAHVGDSVLGLAGATVPFWDLEGGRECA